MRWLKWLGWFLGWACFASASPLEDFIATARERHGEPGEKAARFLVDHMPAKDRDSLTTPFLLDNLDLAFQARSAFPWGPQIPEDLFLNDVLPYAVFDEARDPWRAELLPLARAIVKEARTASEAAQALNRDLFNQIKVHYHTGRRRPNQSPKESMEQGKATCTGLAILLVDACRAVGIPARAVGTPLWANLRGNHTWVEIWDGDWHFTGADEFDKAGLDRGWFVNDASQARAEEPRHAIYATSWKRDGLTFPMVWARNSTEVAAVNVTARYAKAGAPAEPAAKLGVRLWDRQGGQRLVAKVRVLDSSCQPQGSDETKAGTADLNDMPRFELPPGSSGWLHFTANGETRELAFGPLAKGDPTLDAHWNDLRPAAARIAAATCAAPSARPIQVFVLAGQSNMEGQAVADLEGKDYNGGKGTLKVLLNNPAQATRFSHLRNADGQWAVRDDVQVRYQPQRGPLKVGPLTLGFTPYEGRHHFGPELQFGHVVGNHFENPVLLVKTAWGGKSLYADFRPPSAGGAVGPYYLRMVAEVRAALTNLANDFPKWAGNGFELAGLVWYHGWNDGVQPTTAVPEYEQNLAHLIQDLRKEFDAPQLPVVIGEMTGPWKEAPGAWNTLRQAQAAVAARPEFQATVRFVATRDFVRRSEDSPNPTHGHHEFGNAETCLLVGDALGKAMVELVSGKKSAAYRKTEIEGWTVQVSDALDSQPDVLAKALDLLRAQLQEIVQKVPAPAVSKLREVPLWFSPEYPGVSPRAEYHPGAGWLRDNGRDPAMAKAVEFTNIASFEAETRRMPNFALHELAHAYHDRVLVEGFNNPEIQAAFERAKSSGTYDQVERRDGKGGVHRDRAYAMTNPMEYFAELTEAFFSTNDFFPFHRAELDQHDPGMSQLLQTFWSLDSTSASTVGPATAASP